MSENKKIADKSFFKWKNIFFVGTSAINWDKPFVYRYMPYKRIKDIFSKKEITFVSPNKWEDPYEKIYLKAEVKGTSDKLPNVACLCVRSNSCENSDAFWNWSKIKKELWVRVKINLYNLCRDLNTFAKQNEANVYLSSVIYRGKTYIESAAKNGNIVNESLEKTFVRLLSLKRRDYKYEDELRIIIAWKSGKELQTFSKDELLKVKCHLDCIERITVQSSKELTNVNDVYSDLLATLKKGKKCNKYHKTKKIDGITIAQSAFEKPPKRKMFITYPLPKTK